MKPFVYLAAIIAVANAATIVDPSDCTSYPCMIFEDNFDTLDTDAWEHEISMSGGGNWEFQVYDNNRSVSYCRDGSLHIKPQLLTDRVGSDSFLSTQELNLWGMNGRGDVCTGNSYYGCSRTGSATNYVNPIVSARMRTLPSFAYRYGRFEIRAKLPKGDWLWPAVWLLPKNWPLGKWPASGEIDIIEAVGNANGSDSLGKNNRYAGSTLHWGPFWPYNRFDLTHEDYLANPSDPTESYGDGFNTWRMDWNASIMLFYLNDNLVMTIDPVAAGFNNFWEWGNFSAIGNIDNIWDDGQIMTPFNNEFYIILNVAVGGTNGFFPDGDAFDNKPWNNADSDSFKKFWDAKDEWLPTWQPDSNGRPTAEMEVDYVRVYKLENN